MNEAETRAEHIDPALAAAGWGVVEGSRVRREYQIAPGRIEGHGKRDKALTADYVLEYRNHKLAVVEAKAWDVALTEGVAQAKNYGGKLAVRFAYSTNGQGIYAVDMQTGQEREIAHYPTPDELWIRTFAEENAWRDRFAAVPYEDKGGSHPTRYYQDIAIERVIETIAAGGNRILLTLATGTGKTFIAFQIAWKLFHSRWNLAGQPTRRPRILFLADRNILANQAYNAFSAFPEDTLVRIAPDEIRKKGKTPKNGNLFFTIFQTFMSGQATCNAIDPIDRIDSIDNRDNTVNKFPPAVQEPLMYPIADEDSGLIVEAAEASGVYGDYPPDFFDFIVIDECHPDGAPMSAQQFMELLFGKLPEFFKDEAELRAIWSAPDTRKKLLQGLAEKGFGHDQLAEMQKIIDAEKSDLFDVLAHVAYALPPVTREVRAVNAKIHISTHFNAKQQAFLNFVLQHYVTVGVQELDQEKLTPLLRLKYHDSLADAIADLGCRPEEINKAFAGFQKYLYQETVAA